MRIRLAAILAAPLALAGLLVAPPAVAAPTTVNDLFSDLQVAAEISTGYDRDLFNHWVDEDGDSCDTRREVLKDESLVPVTITGSCTITAGEWFSWFDGTTWTDPGELDIDHLVPLAEAWRSRANLWSPAQREAYANDLGLDVSLVAVTASVNRSKGDRDPANWLPPNADATCRYVSEWVTVKYRWRLTVDTAEHAAIQGALAGDCGTTSVEAPERAVPIIAAPVSFIDVPGSHTFHTEIAWMGASGISTGWVTPRGQEYRPSQRISREAMAAFTYRLAGSPEFPVPEVSPFRDVAPTDVFYREITWLVSQGITTGYPDGTFRPRNQITREAMAAFMYRYEKQPAVTYPTNPIFTDVPTNHTFYREVTWMAKTGISTGYAAPRGCYTYKPRANVSREAMAAFMYRLEVGGTTGIHEGCEPPPPPPPQPYYGTVTSGAFCAAANRGWYGHTATGVLMQCKTSATDSRLRWRAV